MNPSAIWTMTASDLRQRLRDRSVFVFGLAVPFALMFVFNLLFSGVGSADTLDPVTVEVAGASGDDIAQGLVQTLQSVELLDVTIDEVAAEPARAAVADGDAQVAIIFPDDFTATLASGASPEVEAVTAGDGSIEDQIVLSITDGYVERIAASSQAATAAGISGVDGTQIEAIAQEVARTDPTMTISSGRAADEQLSLQGSLVAGQTALFMFFTVGFGVIGYLYERDYGTLPRLQSMPMHPRDIIIAKTLVSFILGLLATSVLLGAGSLLFGVSFGSFIPIAVLVVATVAAATSLVLLVVKIARTAEQASTINSIVALVLGVLGGAFFPIGGDGLLATVSSLTPPASFIRGLGITQAGGGVGDLAGPLVNVVGFLVLALVLAVFLPQREVV